MLSKVRRRKFRTRVLFLVPLSLTFATIIPETFAQTPVLVSAPKIAAIAVRPRLVSAPPTSINLSLSEANAIEKRAFELTNANRVANGLPPLVWAAELCAMARAHSENMVRRGFFSHEAPDGSRMTDRARAAGIVHFKALGENIAYNQGFEDPGGFAVDHWMLSPGHRANILNREFQQSAIGVFVDKDGTVYLTQEFILR